MSVQAGGSSVPEQSKSNGDSGFNSQQQTLVSKESYVKKPWVNVVTRSAFSKFDYEVSVVDGKAIVPVPDTVFEDAPALWEDFLIGRFASTAPHVAKIHVIVNKIWNLGDRNIRVDVYAINETSVKFRIYNASARQYVLRRGMWNICDIPMIVSKWTPIVEDAQPEVTSMPMWVKLKNVPHKMFTWKGLSFLSSPLGLPIRLHQDTVLVTNFEEAKVFVEVDLTKELPTSYYFNVQGAEVCVEYEFPWLPKQCSICKKWGHANVECLANTGRGAKVDKDTATVVVSSPAPASKEIYENIQENNQILVQEEEETINLALAELPIVNAEREEGEISTSSPTAGQKDDVGEGEWLQISPSRSRNSGKNSVPLVYGQVRIASPTRYEVLRDQTENEENAGDEDCPADSETEVDTIVTETTKALKEITVSATRATLPRDSKRSHKYLSETSQKAKEITIQSKINNKYTRKKR